MKFSYGVKHSLSSCSPSCGPGRKRCLEALQEKSCEDERKETRRNLGRAFGWHQIKKLKNALIWDWIDKQVIIKVNLLNYWRIVQSNQPITWQEHNALINADAGQELRLMFTSNISAKKSHWLWHWLVVPDGLVRAFQELEISWDFDAQHSARFTQNGEKITERWTKKQIQGSGSSVGGNDHLLQLWWAEKHFKMDDTWKIKADVIGVHSYEPGIDIWGCTDSPKWIGMNCCFSKNDNLTAYSKRVIHDF